MKPRGASAPLRHMAITDGSLDLERVRSRAFKRWLDELAAYTVALQLREKRLADLELLRLAAEVRSSFTGTLLINGRADIALAAGADGVHWTSSSAPLHRLVEHFGSGLLLGVSTHSIAEVQSAADAGLDYAVFGPVFATPSKAAFGPPQGLEKLASAASGPLPVLAVGGIDAQNAPQVLAAGAAGVAAIRGFAEPAKLALAPPNPSAS